jgi:hypothetical protein
MENAMQQDEQGFYDIYQVLHVPFWRTQPFFIFVVVLAILCTLFVLYLLYRSWKKRQAKKVVPTQIRVMQDLMVLQQELKNPDQPIDVTHVYARLGLLLREFLADVHNNQSLLSYTEPELITHVSLPKNENEHSDVLNTKFIDLFGRMSGAKYANAHDIREHLHHDVAVVIEYLKLFNTK